MSRFEKWCAWLGVALILTILVLGARFVYVQHREQAAKDREQLTTLIKAVSESDALEIKDGYGDTRRLSPEEFESVRTRFRLDNFEAIANDQKRYCPGDIWLIRGDARIHSLAYCRDSLIHFGHALFRMKDDPFLPYFDRELYKLAE